MPTIDPEKRAALQAAFKSSLPSEGRADVVSVINYIAGSMLQKIVAMEDLAEASVWLDKLANVNNNNLEEFKNELMSWPTLAQTNKDNRAIDEERSQLYQFAEWIVQLNDSKTTELRNFSQFSPLSKADKKQILSSIQSKLKKTNDMLLYYAGIPGKKFNEEKINFLERLEIIIARLGELKTELDKKTITLEKYQRESEKINKKLKSYSLIDEVNRGDLQKIQALLAEGADPNVYYKANRLTPLHLAVKNKRLDIATALLEKGADPNAQDILGETPLYTCLYNRGYIDTYDWRAMTKVLLKNGADPNISNNIGYTPLAAYGVGYASNEVFMALIAKGADPFAFYKDGTRMSRFYNYQKRLYIKSKHVANRLGFYNYDARYCNELGNPSPKQYIINLACIHSLDELPFILKHASPDFIKELIIYAAEQRRADVLFDIFKNYKRDPTFQFLKNADDVIKEINLCLTKDVLLNPDSRSLIVDKLTSIGINIQISVADSDLRNSNGETLLASAYAKLSYFNSNFYLLISNVKDEMKLKNESSASEIKEGKSQDDIDRLEEEELKKETAEKFLLMLDKSNINSRTVHNQTLLHLVTVSEEKPLLDLVVLLLKGANPLARDVKDKRPIDYLLHKEGFTHHKEILEKGMDYFYQPEHFEELLSRLVADHKRIALLQEKVNDEPDADLAYLQQIKKFLEPFLQAYPMIRDVNGYTLLHRYLINEDCPVDLDTLLNQNVKRSDLDIQSNAGNTALHIAVYNNDEKVVNALLEKGVQLDISNNNGKTPLDLAISVKNCSIINAFLKKDVHPRDSDINTIFVIAAEGNHVGLMTTLLEKYPVTLSNYKLRNIIKQAMAENQRDIINLFIEYNMLKKSNESIQEIFYWAVQYNKLDTVIKLLEKGVDPNLMIGKGKEHSFYYSGITALHMAVRSGNRELVKLLLEKGANSNISSGGRVPLQDLRFYEHKESERDILTWLLVDAKPNAQISNAISIALRTAVVFGNTEAVKLLLEKGADPNIKDSRGIPPLHYSLRFRSSIKPEIVESLLNKGADPLLCSTYDFMDNTSSFMDTPYDLAIERLKLDSQSSQLQKIVQMFYSLLGKDTSLFAMFRLRNEKGKKHLNYLLTHGNALEELPYSLKKPYPELLKALMAHVAEKGRADVLYAIFIDNYSDQQLGFLKKEPKLIQAICHCLKEDSLLSLEAKLNIIKKLKLLSPANIKQMQRTEADIRVIFSPVIVRNGQRTDPKPASHLFFNDKGTLYAKMIKAVNRNNSDLVTKMISENPGANFNMKNVQGRTLLDIAYTNLRAFEIKMEKKEKSLDGVTVDENYALFHYKNMLFILLSNLNINDRTVYNKSILHIAIEKKAPLADLVIFLLKGADPDAHDVAGKKPIDYLLKSNDKLSDHKELLVQGVSYLLKPENNALLSSVAVSLGKYKINKLKAQLEIDITNPRNKLHLERMQQSLEIVKEMIKINNTATLSKS